MQAIQLLEGVTVPRPAALDQIVVVLRRPAHPYRLRRNGISRALPAGRHAVGIVRWLMRILRGFFVLLVLAVLGLGVAYYIAGRADGPAITISNPKVVGQAAPLDVVVGA